MKSQWSKALTIVTLIHTIRPLVLALAILLIVFELALKSPLVGEFDDPESMYFALVIVPLVHVSILKCVDAPPVRQALCDIAFKSDQMPSRHRKGVENLTACLSEMTLGAPDSR